MSKKYDVFEAGRAEFAKLTAKQKKDPMQGAIAAARGVMNVGKKMFSDFVSAQPSPVCETCGSLLTCPRCTGANGGKAGGQTKARPRKVAAKAAIEEEIYGIEKE